MCWCFYNQPETILSSYITKQSTLGNVVLLLVRGLPTNHRSALCLTSDPWLTQAVPLCASPRRANPRSGSAQTSPTSTPMSDRRGGRQLPQLPPTGTKGRSKFSAYFPYPALGLSGITATLVALVWWHLKAVLHWSLWSLTLEQVWLWLKHLFDRSSCFLLFAGLYLGMAAWDIAYFVP